MASIFQADALRITEDESKAIAEASQRVLRHYNVPTVAQETVDWINLITVVGTVYGQRIMAARTERKAAKAAEASRGDNVITLDNVAG